MNLRRLILLSFVFAIGVFVLLVSPVKADELAEIEKQIAEVTRALQMSQDATTPLEAELNRLEGKLNSINVAISQAKENLNQLEQSIDKREADFDQQYAQLAKSVSNYYKQLRQPASGYFLISSSSSSDMIKDLFYRQSVADEDKQTIAQITQELVQLEKDKLQVEADRKRLALLQAKVDKEAEFFRGEIAGAKAYQEELTQKIAELSARQKEILSQKTSTFQTTVGEVPLSADPASRPDYNPGFSPAFAAFSFGAPHFKGMSQYGAYGRAKSGQSAEDILRAYYGSGIEIKKDYSTDVTINVEGYGPVDIETYTKRIYEMPSSWTDNDSAALKAQAVAARSYALARTNNGASSICATESCQVYKPANKGGAWDAAVDATRGWVLMAGGQPFSAWYASTSGGYQESYTHNGHSTPGMWDTKCGNQGCWTSEAYEKISGSPWFYKGWYKSRSGDSCGRSHPWLTSEEMADILNAWVVIVDKGQSDDRVVPIGSCWGGNPYSISELRSRAEALDKGYSSVSEVSVTYGSNGVTAQVTFQTNQGPLTINGLDFKKAFNLRAPGRIALKSGLFNIEKK